MHPSHARGGGPIHARVAQTNMASAEQEDTKEPASPPEPPPGFFKAAGADDVSGLEDILNEHTNEIVDLVFDGDTALINASDSGAAAAVKLLIQCGADVNKTNTKTSKTALMSACGAGDAAAAATIVGLLLEAGANVRATNHYGDTALSFASVAGHLSVSRLLLYGAAEVNSRDREGHTPLLRAAHFGHELLCSLLLDKKAELDATNRNGDSALIFAVRNNRPKATTLLLNRGADKQARNRKGLQPIDIARQMEHLECECLLDDNLVFEPESPTRAVDFGDDDEAGSSARASPKPMRKFEGKLQRPKPSSNTPAKNGRPGKFS